MLEKTKTFPEPFQKGSIYRIYKNIKLLLMRYIYITKFVGDYMPHASYTFKKWEKCSYEKNE